MDQEFKKLIKICIVFLVFGIGLMILVWVVNNFFPELIPPPTNITIVE